MILTEEQIMIRDMAREFACERLLPNAARWDRESHFPAEELAEMGELGLYGMTVPEAWGGSETGYVAFGGGCHLFDRYLGLVGVAIYVQQQGLGRRVVVDLV